MNRSFLTFDTLGSFVDVFSASNDASLVIGEPEVDFPTTVFNRVDLKIIKTEGFFAFWNIVTPLFP